MERPAGVYTLVEIILWGIKESRSFWKKPFPRRHLSYKQTPQEKKVWAKLV